MLTDLYQLTMAYGYWKSGRAEREAVFHLFFRKAPFNGGYAQLDPAQVSLSYNGTAVLVAGQPQHTEPNVDGAACTIDLDLGLGEGSAGYLTSDLSYDYVRINAEYRS